MPSPKWFGDKSLALLQPLNSKICYAESHETASKPKTMRVCQKLTASPRPRSASCSHSNTATDINLFVFLNPSFNVGHFCTVKKKTPRRRIESSLLASMLLNRHPRLVGFFGLCARAKVLGSGIGGGCFLSGRYACSR